VATEGGGRASGAPLPLRITECRRRSKALGARGSRRNGSGRAFASGGLHDHRPSIRGREPVRALTPLARILTVGLIFVLRSGKADGEHVKKVRLWVEATGFNFYESGWASEP